MRLRSTRLASAGMGVGLPAPTARLDLTTEAAIDALLSYHIAQAQLERLTARAPIRQGE